MYFFTIEAIPMAHSPELNGGAYINCWINFPIMSGARLLACHYIRSSSWIPRRVTNQKWITRDLYAENPESLSYFDEAEKDGASFVYHCYPKPVPARIVRLKMRRHRRSL